jgi:phosphatidylinositol phospholipase C delta
MKDGDKGEPITYHGFTLTSKILFKDVIKTVKDYGFGLSEFPIIISLENQCSSKQQERMSKILKEEL